MSEISIPCEKIARLSAVLKYFPDSADEWTNTFRFEDNYIMATNRCYMAVERFDGKISKPVHIIAEPDFIAQCVLEAQYSSMVTFVIEPMLGIATAKTTMGYNYPGNLLMTSKLPNTLDNWKNVIPRDVSKQASGGMLLDTQQLMMLVETSPSKHVIFEERVDIKRPTIVRDLIDPDWFGIFYPKDIEPHDPAKIPEWFK